MQMTLEFSYHSADGNQTTERKNVDMIIFKDIGASKSMVMWDFKGGDVPDFFPAKISNPGTLDMTMEELDDMQRRKKIPVLILDVDLETKRITSRNP